MERKPLGKSGLSAAPIMLGTNNFGWTIGQQASNAVLDAFVAQGGSLLDTADVYSAWIPGNKGGESETMIGNWLRSSGKRDKVLIATKVGLLDGPGGRKLQPSRIAAAVDESLKRLQVDVIDLYFAHRDDPSTPLEDMLDAFDRLVKAGKVRAIGASNYSAERLAEALAVSDRNGLTRFSVVEPFCNLLQRDQYEGPLQDLVVAEGLAAVPYFGLARGYLSGKYRTAADLVGSNHADGAAAMMAGKGPAMLAVMDDIAAETGARLAAIALAWLRQQPGVAAPISSATSAAQVNELMSSTELTLSNDQIERLNRAGA